MAKKYIQIILLFLLFPINVIAQTSYYYYKGERIPLTVDENKVCLSIPKNKRAVSKELLKDVQVLDTIRDSVFDISIILQPDLKRLSTTKSWKKEAKSILLSPSYRTKEGREVFLTPYLNVRLKKEQDIDLLSSYAERYGLRIVKEVSLMPLWYILSISSETAKNSLDVANEMWESGEFAASVPDLSSANMTFCANDPEFDQQWGLYNNDYQGIDISVCGAWNYSTGKNVKIAILDTGIYNNNDLSPNISNLSYDTETGFSPSGFYGDHGTQCAGIAAAVKDNGIDVAGVAPESTIIPISHSLDYNTSNFHSKLACGIKWAYRHGADIISNSWGSPTPNPIIDEAILKAFRYGRNGKGCVIVFATGNSSDSIISYPANCNDTILAVGAINNTGARSSFSDYGQGLDLVAPGDSIRTILPYNRIKFGRGTSFACPHVAGVAALILQRNPELTVTQVNSIVCRNAKKLSNVNFNVTKSDGSWNNEYGYGLVNAYSAVINTPEIVYIQNDTITGTKTIPEVPANPAQKIYVGRNVTDRKGQGNVILGQGNIALNAKTIIIKNSTTVPLGTKLRIGYQ